MANRRSFIKKGLTGAVAINLLPAINAFANQQVHYTSANAANLKLRFALISDGHYAEPNTDSDVFFSNMMNWLTKEHEHNHLDFVIINGDLVHNRPDLLPKVKQTYFDKLPVPYHTIPGNHDFADAAIWKNVFGYEDKYTLEFGDIGFVLANTADTQGKYVCPDVAFLKASFEAYKDKVIVFAILHIAPHQWVPEDKSVFLDCPDVVELLHAYPNIKAAFHGHDHNQDGVKYTGNKFPHFFDSHFGGSWGTDYKGYRIVEVDQQNQVFTYQVNASQNPRLNSNKL